MFPGMGQAERDDKGNTGDRAERLGGGSGDAVDSVGSWMNRAYEDRSIAVLEPGRCWPLFTVLQIKAVIPVKPVGALPNVWAITLQLSLVPVMPLLILGKLPLRDPVSKRAQKNAQSNDGTFLLIPLMPFGTICRKGRNIASVKLRSDRPITSGLRPLVKMQIVRPTVVQHQG